MSSLNDLIDSATPADSPTARLLAIHQLKRDIENEWLAEGHRVSQLSEVTWEKLGTAVGMSAKLASYYFGDEATRHAWKLRNRENQNKLRATQKGANKNSSPSKERSNDE